MYFKAGTHKENGLRYSPFKALIAPRPIGWISTKDKQGNANLAPYSFFNAISELPPMVMFSSAPKMSKTEGLGAADYHKDSLANIQETGEFAVNISGLSQIDAMIASGVGHPADIDEFETAGLGKIAAKDIDVPLVEGAPAHLECKLHDCITLPGTADRDGCVMVIGHVISIHIDEAYITDGIVDTAAFAPLGRLGYKDYCAVETLFEKEGVLAPR